MKLLVKYLLLVLVISSVSCVAHKKKSEISKIGKAYQNMTSHYNGYFNADELITANIKILEDQQPDNFNKILDVYEYSNADDASVVKNDLDEAIKKVSVVVNIHEKSDWIDDCYLLFGKAQYFKQDYEGAEEAFSFMIQEFDPKVIAKVKKKSKGKTKKKKKSKSKKKKNKEIKKKKKERKKANKKIKKKRKKSKKKKSRKKKSKKKNSKKKKSSRSKTTKDKVDESDVKKAVKNTKPKKEKVEEKVEKTKANKGEGGLFKRKPAFQESRLWLAKTYIERESYSSAEFILDDLEKNPNTYEAIKSEIPALKADSYIKQEKYSAAIPQLELAIQRSKTKATKARFQFIIAQLYEHNNKGSEAYEAYRKVLKYKPKYDMEFRSRLNMLTTAWKSRTSTQEQVQHSLKKLLKDGKNTEFKDQIYYKMALVFLDVNNKKEAITNLRNSLNFNTENTPQRAESYLLMAKLYFEEEDYVASKNYYDSTLTVLPQNDDRYLNAKSFAENLKDIAKNITIINLQDSLLTLSNLSDKEKKKFAKKYLKRLADSKKSSPNQANGRMAAATRANRFNPQGTIPSRPSGRNVKPSKASTFFAYNQSKIKSGNKSFKKEWGERPLKDNWRLVSIVGSSSENIEQLSNSNEEIEYTDSEIASVLKLIPSTEAEKRKSNKKILDAMYSLGTLYRDRLDRNDKCIETLEKMNSRYVENEYELNSWYYLYIAHKDSGNSTATKAYYDKITRKYPTSTFARVLKDPNFLNESNEAEKRLGDYYDEVYATFNRGEYKETIDKITVAESKFKDISLYKARFALLNAMCIGNLKGKEEYIKSLNEVIAKYPNTKIEDRAKEIKRLLGGEKTNSKKNNSSGERLFKKESSKIHYAIVVFEDEKIKLNKAKTDVSDYNIQYHNLKKFRLSSVRLGEDNEIPMIVIRKFKNEEEAMSYYNDIMKNPDRFLSEDLKYKIYMVTQKNYRTILKNRNLGEYPEFFNTEYL